MSAVVLDADSLIKRCIMASALDDLRAGVQPTGGVYGTLTSLVSFLNAPDLRPGAIYACYDAGVPKFRLRALPDYKAQRKERKKLFSDEDKVRVFAQMGLARKMLKLLGVVNLKYKHREADDVVAAVTRLLRRQGHPVVVVTGDRDLWQTVGMGARVWDLTKRRFITPDNFADVAGVPVEHFLLYKALIGDSSDGIEGAPGVGPKRAVQLLDEHAAWFEDGAEPADQLAALIAALHAVDHPRKFEQGIIEREEYLRRVLEATDLSNSFGKTGKLRDATYRTPDCRLRPFLRFCQQLHFKSVLGDPQRFFRPFQQAYERRCGVESRRVTR